MVYFEQKKGEEVVEVIRKSFYTIFPGIFKSLSFSLPAIYLLIFVDIPLLTIVSFAWIVILLAFLLYLWLIWYYDVYILTTDRIVEVKHHSLFIKEVKELTLDKAQDVNYSTEGFLSTILGYGTVSIGSNNASAVKMIGVGSPREIQKIILELMGEEGEK